MSDVKKKKFLFLDDDSFHPEHIRHPRYYYPLIGADEILKIFDEIDGFELKKGLLSHTLIINFSDGKKLKYKISKYVIPYPWHNESVKRLINNGE